uniref:Glutamate receptor ionotropic 2 n=1 Tax=Cryptocotyle lingua TaxID=66766 RepID=A0A7U0TIE2_9TREM|nr:glutamate receptor ionotropic 2 [Cryptocotyle lingua]
MESRIIFRRCPLYIQIFILVLFAWRPLRAYESVELAIGAIIEKNDLAQEICFRKSVSEANKLLKMHDSQRRGLQLIPVIERITEDDSFDAARKACHLLERQVIAIYGPNTPNAMESVQSLANQFGIPHLQIDWGYRQSNRGFALNVHPHYLAYGQALYDYVSKAEYWDTVALIYYRKESLYKYDYLLRNFDHPVTLRKWDKDNDNYKYVIKQFKTTQTHFRFIVDIPFWEVQEFLSTARTYNMTSQYYSYVFTDWDIQLVDPAAFSAVEGANITTFSILRPLEEEGYGIVALLDDIRLGLLQDERFARATTSRRISPTQSALLYDGLSLLAMGLLASSRTADIVPPTGITCSSTRGWNPGLSLMNDIRAIQPENFRGLTGKFQFDGQGWRSNINLNILEYSPDGFRQFGYWNMEEGLIVTRNFSHLLQEMQTELKGKVLRITTKEEKPYMMYKGNASSTEPKSTDPKDWRGFCIDLLNEIGKELNFTYTINLVPDSTYGNAKMVDGEEVWDGMVQELRTRKADLAVGSFTITYDRERVIDFTTPFMYLGISIIYKRIEDKEASLFSFLHPLSAPVWGYILAATIMVSLVLFVVARFTPYEWKADHPCNVDSNVLENKFDMLNSIWYTFGALMQKGSDVVPHAMSTRIIAGFWWFFTLIVISSYTANLAAYLTVARMEAPIENAEDLAKQTKIKYGTIQGGSTAAFFEHSKFPTYKLMWQFMSTQKGVLMNSTEDAIRRVKREEYAFILESTMNEYYTQRDCALIQVGGLLDSKGYGIGLPEGSKYRDPISETILKLQHSQTIHKLKFRWWQEMDINVTCDANQNKQSDTSSLDVDKVSGCFVMLLIGMAAAMVVSLFEFLYDAYERIPNTKRTLKEEAARAFRFSTTCASLRSRMAEEAAQLPPPPSLSCGSGKETFSMASALAYAPCLPPPEFPSSQSEEDGVTAKQGVTGNKAKCCTVYEPSKNHFVEARKLDNSRHGIWINVPGTQSLHTKSVFQTMQRSTPTLHFSVKDSFEHRYPDTGVDDRAVRIASGYPNNENMQKIVNFPRERLFVEPSSRLSGPQPRVAMKNSFARYNPEDNRGQPALDTRAGARDTKVTSPEFFIKKVAC